MAPNDVAESPWKRLMGQLAHNRWLHRFLDLLVLLSAAPASMALRMGSLGAVLEGTPATDAYIVAASLVGLCLWFGFDLESRAAAYGHGRDMTYVLLLAAGTIPLAMLSGYLVDRLEGIPRSLPVFNFALLLFGLLSVRLLATKAADWSRAAGRQDGFDRHDCLLIGRAELTQAYVNLLRVEHLSSSAIAGLLTDQAVTSDVQLGGVPVLGATRDLSEVLTRLRVHGVSIRLIVLLMPRAELSQEVRDVIAREKIAISHFYDALMGDPAVSGSSAPATS